MKIWKSLNYNDTAFAPGRNWYYEHCRNSKSLLITAGDSWTWGDSLGRISSDGYVDDFEHRITHIYGSLLAEHMQSDHVNIGICGGSNVLFYDHLINLLSEVHSYYNQIIVILTLTELCREIKWDDIWIPKWDENSGSLDDFLKEYERNMFNSIQKFLLTRYPDVQFLIAHNFTKEFNDNREILGTSIIEKSWVDCLSEHQTLQPYPEIRLLTAGMAINPLIQHMKKINCYTKYKLDLFDIYNLGIDAIDWLDDSDLNYSQATRHPTEDAHVIWADYLKEVINA